MHDKDLYKKFLGIDKPWFISQVTMDDAALTIQVLVEVRGEPYCPRCRKACSDYDSRRRSWRHFDFCQYKKFLVGDIPRVQYAEHGVMQIDAPWADRGLHFTALFECVVIDWLREANQSGVDFVPASTELARSRRNHVACCRTRTHAPRKDFADTPWS